MPPGTRAIFANGLQLSSKREADEPPRQQRSASVQTYVVGNTHVNAKTAANVTRGSANEHPACDRAISATNLQSINLITHDINGTSLSGADVSLDDILWCSHHQHNVTQLPVGTLIAVVQPRPVVAGTSAPAHCVSPAVNVSNPILQYTAGAFYQFAADVEGTSEDVVNWDLISGDSGASSDAYNTEDEEEENNSYCMLDD